MHKTRGRGDFLLEVASKNIGGLFMKKYIIFTNKIRCKKCGDIIESTWVHDFKQCKCGAVAVDGGHEYMKRLGNVEDWEELSEWQ